MKRRGFILRSLGVAAGLGAALVVGWAVLPPRSRLGSADSLLPREGAVAVNGWVRVQTDGRVVLIMPRSEMGQGVHTGLVTLLAEELDLPLDSIVLEQAPDETIYGNVAMLAGALPFHPLEVDADEPALKVRAAHWIFAKVGRELGLNVTGGSASMADAWSIVRMAGAAARAALLAAAAEHFDAPVSALSMYHGEVSHTDGRRIGFGDLAQRAASIDTPDAIRVKPRWGWRFIGQPVARVDVPAKVDGSARYGIDVRPPGLEYAAVCLCPTLGGSLRQLDEKALLARPGVRQVVTLPPCNGTSGGFAVIASHTWHAEQACRAAQPQWDHGPNHALSTASIGQALERALDEDTGHTFYARGDAPAALAGAGRKLTASYHAPHLAHATLEPMNATAWFHDGTLEIWAPTQAPGFAAGAAAKVAGLDSEQVHLHVTYLGGGFGRRLESDFVAQAALVAMALPGVPVQLIWSREQDMTHDFYRPLQRVRLEGLLDDAAGLQALRIRSAGDSIVTQWIDRNLPFPGGGPDRTTAEGLFDQPYAIAHQLMTHVTVPSGVPIGFWRSVGHSHSAFFIESFIDELAHAAGADPYEFRLSLLGDAPRHALVLRTAADAANWYAPLPVGQARGIALHESFGSIVAQVAEVSLQDGKVQVHRMTCAIDCGTAVNPDIVRQQMESCVVFGLTAALHGQIDIQAGQVQQQNFPDYPLLGMAGAPPVSTHIIASQRPPTGVGEPGLPPVAPAVSNALYALTGKRQRELPLQAV